MTDQPTTLKVSDTGDSGTIEFVRKRRNDVPLVIEIDPDTDHTRYIRVRPEALNELILLLCAARGDFCECPEGRMTTTLPKQERRCRTCHKNLIEDGA